MLQAAIRSQLFVCNALEKLLPEPYRIDGNTDFLRHFAPRYIPHGSLVYDVGSGKQPYLSPSQKAALGATVVGLDISQYELSQAPEGTYDSQICADIIGFQGDGRADVVVCQSLLEHVPDVHAAYRAIASCLRPGGVAVVFVPCRNALYARLNLMLPEAWKKKALQTFFPGSERAQGFPAFYDRCTPRDFRRMAESVGLEVAELKCYYRSAYFDVFVPAWFAWRVWSLLTLLVLGEQSAETFSVALRKPVTPPEAA